MTGQLVLTVACECSQEWWIAALTLTPVEMAAWANSQMTEQSTKRRKQKLPVMLKHHFLCILLSKPSQNRP